MRIGAISDIHSNLPALEAVLNDMSSVDALVCAGDVVGYYTWPAACVEAVRDRDIPTVMGNHDRALVRDSAFRFRGSARAGLDFARDRLEEEHLSWVRALPDDRVLFDDRVRVVHGHPHDPDRYTYPADVTGEILQNEPVLLLGHTHVQFHRRLDEGVVCNPGSVGQPRDHDPRAAYAILDLETLEVDERRVEYDLERTQAAVREQGLPQQLATRLAEGR